MKKIIALLSFAAFVAMGTTFVSCNGGSAEKQEVQDSKEYTSAYICPMHCKGSGSTEPGKCPVCGMDYVVNEDGDDTYDHDHEGHDHDHEGHGHDH